MDFRRNEKSFSKTDVPKLIVRLNQTSILKKIITLATIDINEISIPKLFNNKTIKIINEK